MSERAFPNKKSTIGRSKNSVPRVVHFGFRLLSRLAPALTTRVAEVIFLRPPRHPVPAREREWLEGARELSFQSAGRRLAGWVWGDGPVVLLVHGWAGRGSQLGAFVRPLVEQGFRVVAYDAPGHGASSGRRSSIPEIADAVASVAEQAGPVKAIIAHSLGSAAVTVALGSGLSPERCVYLAPPSDLEYFSREFARILGMTPEIPIRMRRRIERRFGIQWETLEAPAVAASIATPPLLVFHDVADPEVPFEQGEILVRVWKNASLAPTSGLGHRAILRDPTVIERAVRFLTAETPSAASRQPRRLYESSSIEATGAAS